MNLINFFLYSWILPVSSRKVSRSSTNFKLCRIARKQWKNNSLATRKLLRLNHLVNPDASPSAPWPPRKSRKDAVKTLAPVHDNKACHQCGLGVRCTHNLTTLHCFLNVQFQRTSENSSQDDSAPPPNSIHPNFATPPRKWDPPTEQTVAGNLATHATPTVATPRRAPLCCQRREFGTKKTPKRSLHAKRQCNVWEKWLEPKWLWFCSKNCSWTSCWSCGNCSSPARSWLISPRWDSMTSFNFWTLLPP